jgi:hypothetical protein
VEPQAAAKTACIELHNGVVTFTINVNFDPNTYPFLVTGGTITAGICGAPWALTGGSLGNSLRIEATRQGTGSCANTIIILGETLRGCANRRVANIVAIDSETTV